jgi:hypothetical protein
MFAIFIDSLMSFSNSILNFGTHAHKLFDILTLIETYRACILTPHEIVLRNYLFDSTHLFHFHPLVSMRDFFQVSYRNKIARNRLDYSLSFDKMIHWKIIGFK